MRIFQLKLLNCYLYFQATLISAALDFRASLDFRFPRRRIILFALPLSIENLFDYFFIYDRSILSGQSPTLVNPALGRSVE